MYHNYYKYLIEDGLMSLFSYSVKVATYFQKRNVWFYRKPQDT